MHQDYGLLVEVSSDNEGSGTDSDCIDDDSQLNISSSPSQVGERHIEEIL